ncbi:HET domain-containing protein [Colletotrichum musicola]|uniref:HET domain-containing protein n=1 Tax=Colletotrichum musicola TaxID=2175873 RepID=A0A8H6J2H8_9PEZI|nr:HET domain-containing protein [Colletotrichum musicola]
MTPKERTKLDCLAYGPPLTRRLFLSQQERLRLTLEACRTKHRGCRSQETAYVPLRLIQISRDKEGFNIRLQSRDSLRKAESYAALSYCWEGDQPYKTTQGSVQAYSQVIPWGKIGRTIQDAIDVAYNLGIYYLWVDSLCIVQDDKDELDREIPHMPQIYNQAEVTIVASQARSAAEGFLIDTRLEDISNTVAPIRIKSPYFTGDLKAIAVDLEHYFYQPTEKRGWCFQEKWLSRRVLEFETTAVRWSCGSTIEILSLPLVSEPSMTTLEETKQRGRLLSSHDPGYPTSAKASYEYPVTFRSLPAFWDWVVTRYSYRKHSIAGDRAIAVSGLAKVFHGKLKSAYAAGLWEDFLPLELLWQRDLFDPDGLQPRYGIYQGPSWSWTSYSEITDFQNCLMARRNDRFENRLQFLEVKTTLASEMNVFGAVTSGTLTVKGRVKKARLLRPEVSLDTREQYDYARQVRIQEDSVHWRRLDNGDANQARYKRSFNILVDPMPSGASSLKESKNVNLEHKEAQEYAVCEEDKEKSTDPAEIHPVSLEDSDGLNQELDRISLSSANRGDTPEWFIPFRGNDQDLSCIPFPEGYDLGQFGTLLAARMQPDALEEEFVTGSPVEKECLEICLVELGWFSHEEDPDTHFCGPVGLALRELAPASDSAQTHRWFSRLGTFNFDITYGLLRPPELQLAEWRDIVLAQMDWFSDCEAETIEFV